MSQKFFSGLTATLLISTLGIPLAGHAKPAGAVDPISETDLKLAANSAPLPALDLTSEVVKLGEQQPQIAAGATGGVIAKVHPHEQAGREAATLYVRNIPVLTFLGSTKTAAATVKMGTQMSTNSGAEPLTKSLDSAPANKASAAALVQPGQQAPTPATNQEISSDDPVWRASELATRLNQFSRDGVNAKSITVRWDEQSKKSGSDRFIIQVGEVPLAIVDANTILPDTTQSLENDALQVTNRLRRLLGNADPLSEVTGKPRRTQEIALGPLRLPVNGWASWYGPGFHGNQSASGERFNQHALTAAHRTLPFGTQVRVTNLDNGVSVVVRINDRGPFHGNRIIDLSMGAAHILGLVQTGVAPVRLDVVPVPAVTAGN